MVIAINTRLLLKGKFEGINWFTFETLSRITKEHPEHQFIFIFDRPYSPEFIFSDNITPVVAGPPTRHPVLWYIWFQFRVPAILRRYKACLFLSTDGYLSLRTKIPQIAVIHDINFLHRPGDMPPLTSKYYNHYFPKFAAIARRVATVSNYSKADIARSFKIDLRKIDIVYSGINRIYSPTSEDEQNQARLKFSGGAEYFLFVGALHPRKNVGGLLKAFDIFKNSDKQGVKLLIVGGEMFKTGDIHETYKNLRFKDDVIFTGRVSPDEIRQIYGAALALTFVPYFEGFGLPLVEAMSVGIPVICSNTTSLPEVGGGAVYYASPDKPDQIADAMLALSTDKNLRETLIQKGFEQKLKFSWDETARLLWICVEKVLKEIKG